MVESLRADVLVVGAGPGGLAAAVHAAEAGAKVLVVDARGAPGGQIWRNGAADGLAPEAAKWIARARDARVRFVFDAEVFDAPSARKLWASTPEGVVSLQGDQLILATGARERFLPFAGWDRPKVMGVGALQALCKEGFDLRGQRVVLAGSGPLLMAVGADLQARGAESVKLIEQAPRARVWKLLPRLVRHPGKLGQAARFGIKLPPGSIRYGSWIESAVARPDGFELRLAGKSAGDRLEADVVGCAFGLIPETALAESLGCESRVEGVDEGESVRIVVDAEQRTSVAGVFAVGELCGIGGVECSLAEGAVAGEVAAGRRHGLEKLQKAVSKARDFGLALGRSYALDPRLKQLPREDTILCRCEGVRASVARGFDDLRTAKLQTRCGMGPCQGRVCGPAFEFLTDARERSAPRAPIVPTSLCDLATAWSASSETANTPGA
jgi:NADPH-dependent 2,4-dienoyl-CoA reductase/sulfur reductase-like enzyme